MSLIRYAIKSIFRHKKSSIIVGLTIVFATFIMIVGMSYGNAIKSNIINNTIKTFLGHIQIHHTTDNNLTDLVLADKSSLEPIDNYKSLISDLTSNEDVLYAVPRIQMAGIINHGELSAGSVVVGVDAQKEFEMSTHYEISEGRFLKDGERGILLTAKNKNKLKVDVGDQVMVRKVDSKGNVTEVTLPVVGIAVAPGIEPFVSHLAYVDLESAKTLNNVGDKVTNIAVVFKSGVDGVNGFEEDWKNTLDKNDLQVDTYETLGAVYVGIGDTFTISVLATTMVIFLLILLIVLNISLMAIYQRVREIGTLAAIGMGPAKILFIVIFQFFFLGLISSSIGIVAGSILISILSKAGIPAGSETMAAVYGGNYLYLKLSLNQIISTFLVSCGVCIIAVVFPAIKAVKIQPIEALSTE